MMVHGYARVSTEEQSRDGLSLVTQEGKIRMFCQLQELALVELVKDAGISGKTLDRPGLAIVLDDLRRGDVAGIVIAKLDRLTRSLADWSCLIDLYFNERAGRKLFSAQDSIDTRTAGGRMVLNLLVMVAQWERETIAERTKDALQGKISRSERAGTLRFGYTLNPDRRTVAPDPDEQAAIDLMRRMRDAGHTYQEVVDELHRLRIDTKVPGALWHPSTVHQILRRPIP